MQYTAEIIKPRWQTFASYFLLSFICLMLLGTIAYWWILDIRFGATQIALYLLLSAGSAMGVTLGAKRIKVVIGEGSDVMEQAVVNALIVNGQRLKQQVNKNTLLESQHVFNKLFWNWFGTELTSVNYTDGSVVVEGPQRVIENLKSSLKRTTS